MKRLEFVTGRFYAVGRDQLIKAVEIGELKYNDDTSEQKVIFVDEVRQIAGVIDNGEFSKANILSCYDQCLYRDATSDEQAIVNG